MNWEAIAAVGEIVSAMVVALPLGYFAIQLRAAKAAAADINRLERAKGVREMMLATSLNNDLRETVTKGLKLESYYQELGKDLQMSPEEASTFDWAMLYWFWLHWGQFASETRDTDIEELANVVRQFYANPGVRECWERSPWAKPVLEHDFVSFVDEVLKKNN